MKNMQEQQQCKGLFNSVLNRAFAIPENVIFADPEPKARPPVKDIFYDLNTSRYGYIDCPECDNRGCDKCLPIRRSIQRIKKSGLGELLDRCTFENFTTPESWQQHAKDRIIAYTQSRSDSWLYFAGQSGCGKTHLCTAACKCFLDTGYSVLYKLWRDLVHEWQGVQFKPEEYNKFMQGLRDADVLYIDDFLKTPDKNAIGRELTAAYEIINTRYNLGGRTIISSELHLNELCELEEATGGRISERAAGHIVQIQKSKGRNFRLRT